jgi:hypothetical protein
VLKIHQTVEAGVVEAEEPMVEAEAPTVEDGVLPDRALAGALKRRPEYWRQPGHRSPG